METLELNLNTTNEEVLTPPEDGSWNKDRTTYTVGRDMLSRYTEATLLPAITGPNLTAEDTDNSIGAGANDCITSINDRCWIHADSGGGMDGFEFFVSNFVRRPIGKKKTNVKESVSLAGVGSSKNKYQVAVYDEVGFRTPDGTYIIVKYEYDFGDTIKGQLMSIDDISSREFHDYCDGITVRYEEVTREEFIDRHGLSPIYDGFYSKSRFYNDMKFKLNLFSIRKFISNRTQNNNTAIQIEINGESIKCPKLVYPTTGKAVVLATGQMEEGTNELGYNYHTLKTKTGGEYIFKVYKYEAIRSSSTHEVDDLIQKADGVDNIHKDYDKLDKPIAEILAASNISCYEIDVTGGKVMWDSYLNNLKYKVVMTADSPNVPFSADKTKSADTTFEIALRAYLKKLTTEMGWESKTAARQKTKQETLEVLNWKEILENDEHESYPSAILTASKIWGVSADTINNSKLDDNVYKVYDHDVDFVRDEDDLVEWQINDMDDEHYTEFIARLSMEQKFKTATWVHGGEKPLQIKKLEKYLIRFGARLHELGLERVQLIHKSFLFKVAGYKEMRVYSLNTY
tara:strand:- start:53 stop:1765 length:1713 start_codon:yes stop_codon:yes gene_type:complete